MLNLELIKMKNLNFGLLVFLFCIVFSILLHFLSGDPFTKIERNVVVLDRVVFGKMRASYTLIVQVEHPNVVVELRCSPSEYIEMLPGSKWKIKLSDYELGLSGFWTSFSGILKYILVIIGFIFLIFVR
jgi:uncharacterized membrane protein YraQ (UPF0718 family)